MKSLAVRLALFSVFVVAAGVAAFFFWTGETRSRIDQDAARVFDVMAVSAQRDVLELRTAQQGYVAAGQGDQFWVSKVASAAAALRDKVGLLRTKASSPASQSAIDNAASALQDFDQMDRRARDYARNGQKLLASDLIFANGIELTGAAAAALDQARAAELEARESVLSSLRRRALSSAATAAAVGVLVIALLVPVAESRPLVPLAAALPRSAAPARVRRQPALDAVDEGWSPAKPSPKPAPAPSVAPAPALAPAPAATVDLTRIASLCADLARVTDTQALPAILERAAVLLDAPGIVLWIADPDGHELSPIVTHGYTPQIVTRLGRILREDQNATASAFRTALLQTVNADAVSNGAIAAPLVTTAGCVGVMAAEIRGDGHKDSAKLATATIVAAQLSALMGPPSARSHVKSHAAGA